MKISKKDKAVSDIQSIITIAFTISTLVVMIVLGIVLYNAFARASYETAAENAENINNTAVRELEDELYNIRKSADALYYNTIREYDISDPTIQNQINLLYDANKDRIASISLFDTRGRLIAASPLSTVKDNVNILSQVWFTSAINKRENYQFSEPHVENIFDDTDSDYKWVISVSKSVDISDGSKPLSGVLLINIDYGKIRRTFDEINRKFGSQYIYVAGDRGNIIYHPRARELDEGVISENNIVESAFADGMHEDRFKGSNRYILVDSVSYTGWKIINVMPRTAVLTGSLSVRYFMLIAALLTAMTLLIINRLVAKRISLPIKKLDDSVKAYESGGSKEIYKGGSTEIRHLGGSIEKSLIEIDELMKEAVTNERDKRHSEMAALQSQINPHFLYNTLDSITWMIEGEKNDEAVDMISQLAKLLRISISKGRNIITVGDEFTHAESYMNIQKVRYKDRFTAEFSLDERIRNCCTVKLLIQPLLENSIYYGVSEYDGDGLISVKGELVDHDVVITVSDNGTGMEQEYAEKILTMDEKVAKHGNGVGDANVNNRIKLLFGENYGLKIKSEPDVGTEITIIFPAITYNDENRALLEKGIVPEERL